MNQIQATYDDEIDLREIIQTLLNDWKVVLLPALLAGAVAFGVSSLLTPVYEASAMVAIDQKALGLSINPVNILLSDATRLQAAEVLDLPVGELPSISVAKHNTGNTIFVVTVESEDSERAMRIANAWSEAGLAVIGDTLSLNELEGESAQLALTQAEQALIDYLDANDLSSWSWTDLVWLTGIGQQLTIHFPNNSEDASDLSLANSSVYGSTELAPPILERLPSISLQQRFEISQLMRIQLETSDIYDIALERATDIRLSMVASPPQIFSYATAPKNPVSPKTLMNTALGVALGLMLGVFWVFVAEWWQNSDGNSAAAEEKVVHPLN